MRWLVWGVSVFDAVGGTTDRLFGMEEHNSTNLGTCFFFLVFFNN